MKQVLTLAFLTCAIALQAQTYMINPKSPQQTIEHFGASDAWSMQNIGLWPEENVQQQIAAIPDELPTVTASDNGKFLRVVNGAWAAQTVPSAESNSFGGGS